ncbi:MAG: hypothetical protein EOM64_06945 [Erysipelotrichia bacterium]|nr:hypothetical protein [Erysipelotrichia bacterium]
MKEKIRKISTSFDSHGVVFVILILFFAIFFAITCASPLSGDDWGYATVSQDMHPILLLIDQYMTWSGRILSEFWGYTITRNKWMYDILNPIIFTTMFVFLLKNARVKKHPVFSAVIVFYLIFSVYDYVRMQTYTWCMGETYIIPLMLFLIYIFNLYQLLFAEEGISSRMNIWMWVISFCIPLYMENAAGMLVGSDVLVLIYCWFKDKKHFRTVLTYSIIAAVGTCIIGLSPGAHIRLVTTHADFAALSLFTKIYGNWKNFLSFTFMNNKSLILTLSIVSLLFIWIKRDSYRFAKWHLVLLSLPFLYAILQVNAETLSYTYGQNWANILFDLNLQGCTRINSIGYGLWVVAMVWMLLTYLDGSKRLLSLYVFICAGGANMVMLLSPIFDARSSVYTIYMLILLTLLLLEELTFNSKAVYAGVTMICALISVPVIKKYAITYYQVFRANNERQFQLRGFAEDPTIKDLYIVRMPRMSLHSADVEEGDDYHMKYFKKYYNLDPDTNLHFYFRDSYEYYGEPIY